MELVTSWEHAGQERIIARLIKKRFGSIPPEVAERLDTLSANELDELGEELLDFTSPADLESWLARHQRN
jgi:phage terminase Nu1 subunit (DNA packaging protein)